MVTPTPQALALAALTPAVGLLLVMIDPGLWLSGIGLTAALAVAIVIDMQVTLQPRALAVQLAAPRVLHIQSEGTALVRVRRRRGAAPPRLAVCIDTDGPVRPTAADRVRWRGREGRAGFLLVPERRGEARISAIWLRWDGKLGLIRRTLHRSIDRTIPIIPDIRAVRQFAITLQTRDSLFGQKLERRKGDGTEFEALRDFVPGMDPRNIHWRQSARHRALLVREFRTERNHPIILAFDTGHLMRAPLDGISRLDRSINAGLLLGWFATKSGDHVGSFGFDAQVRLFRPARGGTAGLWQLQDACARLDYGTEETNFVLGLSSLQQQLRRRSLIVLFTDFVDTVTAELMLEALGRLSRRHLVVFVCLRDPLLIQPMTQPPETLHALAQTVVADGFLRNRDLVFERLRRLGIACLRPDRAELAPDLLNQYLTIKREDRL